MSSINTTFQPMTGVLVVDNTAAAQLKEAQQKGCSSFRCIARVANGYLAWGRNSTVAAPTAPAAVGYTPGSQNGGVVGLTLGVAAYIEVPPDSFFIGSAAFAAGNIEIVAGIGGVGG